jgi:rhodanese-related sulfurtransferase
LNVRQIFWSACRSLPILIRTDLLRTKLNVNRTTRCIRGPICALVTLFLVSVTGSGQVNGRDAGRYCGIYAVYGAARALSVQGDFSSLLDQQFVSGMSGSTTQDLVKAAEQLGVSALPMSGLGLATLHQSRDPLILHVASFGQLDAWNHWLLFLGIEQGCARTVDESGSVHLMDIPTLLARWDGVGVAVFRGSEPMTRFGSVELIGTSWWAFWCLLIPGVSVLACSRLAGLRGRSELPGVLAAVIATLALIAAREWSTDTSLWQNAKCVRFIAAAEGIDRFSDLTVEQMAKIVETGEHAVILDVRYDVDRQYGQVPGAIGLPIDSTEQFVAKTISGINRDTPVVLYCQSSGCRFSDRMAVALTGFGFTNIRICRDGWAGWEKSQRHRKLPQSQALKP